MDGVRGWFLCRFAVLSKGNGELAYLPNVMS
jgi:hypothetical protein